MSLGIASGWDRMRRRTASLGDLVEEARAWEIGVDELAADNDEVMTYVHQLEESHDAETPESTSGEHIAAEFERYLRRRENS